jgi:hypothetical protein
LLIYNGKIIGCIYGSKRITTQLFGQQAYEKIISELTRFDNFIDGYILPPQYALAAGSMFHEELITAEGDESPEAVARRALALFASRECGGSIVVTNSKNVPEFVMFFSQQNLLGSQVLNKGKSTRGKAPEQVSKLWEYLKANPEAKVFASLLSSQDAASLGACLSALNQSSKNMSLEAMTEEAFHGGMKITLMRAIRTPDIEPVRLNRFINVHKSGSRPGKQMRLSHNFQKVGGYMVDPR